MEEEKGIIEERKETNEVKEESTESVEEQVQVTDQVQKEEKSNKFQKLKELCKNKKVLIAIPILAVIVFILLFGFNKNGGVTNIISPKTFSIVSVEKKSSNDYAATNETFIVKTEKGSLEEVEKHLVIEPAINYRINQKSKDEYEVITKDIPSNQLININYVDNEVAENKWAFQSAKDLTISSIYPANNTSSISVNTSIEISFSYPNVKDINNSVVIEPKVEGTFEQNGRVWILKPTKPLKNNQTYTITIKDDITNGDKKLLEGSKTTFSTHQEDEDEDDVVEDLNYNSITVDDIATFKPSDKPMFRTDEKIAKVEMLKFNSNEDFRKYVSNETNYKYKSLGKVSFKKLNKELYALNQTYKVGYYLLRAYTSKGKLYFSMPVQVNNLQAYLMASQNDFLVWTTSGNKVQSNVQVSYEKNKVNTDKDGIAVIKKYNNKNEKIKYVKVGKDNPIYIGVLNGDDEQIPDAYLYTDRPLYKSTDDVQIFGYIPLKYFENSNISTKDFVLSLEDEKIPININTDGTFTTKYHLNNMQDADMSLVLKYKDRHIAHRYIEVEEYSKEMYDFKIDYNKNYVNAGDKFKFTVTVTHISGVVVPNKEIQVLIDYDEYDEDDDDYKVLKGRTNSEGKVSFSIPTKREHENWWSTYHSDNVKIKCTLTESSQEGYNLSYYVIDRLIDDTNHNYDHKTKTLTATINELSLNKNIKQIDWDMSPLIDKPYTGNAIIQLEETTSVKKITGHEYNEITKENEPEYDYESTDKIVSKENYYVKNGKINYKINYNLKKDTDNTSYDYSIYITLYDKNKVKTRFEYGIYERDWTSDIKGYYRWDYNSPVGNIYYDLYNYYMNEEEKLYSVNNQIVRKLYSYNQGQEVTNNKFLLIKYKNNIIDKKIINNTNNLTTTFNDDDRPGIKITGAYLKDGVIHRLPTEYLDYNQQDSNLDISIKPNKQKYNPQEEVTLDVKVTKKGQGIKSKVNVSVVDEGVFKAEEDQTYILESIYSDMYYNNYTFSTYRDYNLSISPGGGMGSSTGGPRADFGDTLLFKTVETDSNGNAKVKFKMNDSITSFRITAHAANSNVDVGVNHTNVETTLPVSISFTKPQGLKETDDVVLNAIGIGSTKGNIKYTFSIDGVKKKIVQNGKLSQQVYANFGRLPVGKYTAYIEAKTADKTDKVKFGFNVVKTQTEISIKTTENINKTSTIKPTKNPIKLELYRKSYKQYEKYLEILKDTNEDRLDTRFTYNKGLEYDNKYNGHSNKIELGNIKKFKTNKGYKYLPGDKDISYELTSILTYYNPDLAIKKSYFYKLTKSDEIEVQLNGYMNLAAQKEPILDDLHQLDVNGQEEEIRIKIALAYIFLGDYSKAKTFYNDITDVGAKTYLSTFLDKKNASKYINDLYKKDYANRYLYLAIVSYFENNNAGLSTKEEINITYGNKQEKLKISTLGKKYLTIYQDDLKDLKFSSKYNDLYVNYYYDGLLDEIPADKKEQSIRCTLTNNKPKLGTITYLKVDVSKVEEYSKLDLYLPNGLTEGGNINSKSAYISSTSKEKLSIYLGDKHENVISIPLYASSPGLYTIEPIVIKKDDKYQISNAVRIKIS
jgi:hypothetical protein